MATVSAIIPTLNRSETLGRALDSILAQTRPPEEIIVVDDGSTDATTAMIESRYPQVRLIRQANQGVSGARNRGIAAASGEWIALLDSDDEWTKEKLKRQSEIIAVDPDILLCHTDEIWIRNGRRVNPMKKHRKYGGRIFRQCLPLCVISPSSVIIRRALLDEIGMFDETLPACEDYDLWLRVTARYPVAFIEEKLTIKHGGHSDQLSARHWGMDRFRVQALEKILASGELKDGDRDAALATLIEKLAILAAGARKRGREQEAVAWENQTERCTREFGTASGSR